jgi:hypothetical protein
MGLKRRGWNPTYGLATEALAKETRIDRLAESAGVWRLPSTQPSSSQSFLELDRKP